MLNTPYAVELVTTEDALGRIESDWERLSRAADHPNVFTSYGWYNAWYAHFAKKRTPGLRRNVLILRRDGVVSGIVPLVASVSSKFGLSLCRLHFASHDHEWDYNDLVLGDDVLGQTAALAQYLRREARAWDLIDLCELRDTGAIPHIEIALQEAGLSYRTFPEKVRCPYMPIECSWEETMAKHSRSIRREFRRFMEKTREGFRMRVVEDPSREPELLERMIAVEAQKHVGGKLSVPFLGRYAELFRSLFETLGPKGWISVVVMEFGDRLIAWQLLYRCGKKLWGYLTAYDHAFGDLSPGTILVSAAIDHAFANGFDEFDFLKGEENYKMRWATDFHRTYRMVIWNRRWTSRVHAYPGIIRYSASANESSRARMNTRATTVSGVGERHHGE